MAIPRKEALKKLQGLAPKVQEHLAKIALNPGHSSLAKWKGEVRCWVRQMQEVLPHVGKKTGAEWQMRIEEFQAALES